MAKPKCKSCNTNDKPVSPTALPDGRVATMCKGCGKDRFRLNHAMSLLDREAIEQACAEATKRRSE